MSRILAIDWGMRRVGVALSDPTGFLASPLITLNAEPRTRLIEEIGKLVSEYEVEQLLVGIPYHMDGSEGKSVIHARELINDLAAIGIPIREWDERLTSWEATKLLQENNRKPSKNKGLVDRAAAAIMLQNYLDSDESSSGN